MHLLRQVATCIKREKLAEVGQTIYVAVSGGADSVALLAALYSLGYDVRVLHCNFNLRGLESQEDEAFVRALASKHQLSIEVRHFATESYANDKRLSIEMAARELRYSWFFDVLRANPHAKVAVGHNADDVAETFLYNLAQGAGIRGLSGIPYMRSGGIIRPLLDCSREEVESFLMQSEFSSEWREDSSNKDIIYRRNYIRHRLLPCYEDLKADVRKQIKASSALLRGAKLFYLEAIERYKNIVLSPRGIDVELLLSTPHPETLLYEILKDYGFSPKQAESIAEHLECLSPGAEYLSPTYRAVYAWGYIELLERKPEKFFPITIDTNRLPQRYATPLGTLSVDIVSEATLRESRKLCLPMEELVGKKIELRCPASGEWIRPFGMKGKRKMLSRVFIDSKVPHALRSKSIGLYIDSELYWLLGMVKSECTRLSVEQVSNSKCFVCFSLDQAD